MFERLKSDWETWNSTMLEERSRPAINVATFVGAGGLRNYVIGKDNRPPIRYGALASCMNHVANVAIAAIRLPA